MIDKCFKVGEGKTVNIRILDAVLVAKEVVKEHQDAGFGDESHIVSVTNYLVEAIDGGEIFLIDPLDIKTR